MAQLTVSATEDYSDGNPAANDIDTIVFTGAATTAATFAASQFGGTGISNTVGITGNGEVILIDINMVASSAFPATNSFSAAGWTFSNWISGPHNIAIDGTANADTITGSSEADLIEAGAGLDTVDAGAGDDDIRLTSNFVAGETIDGGSHTARDRITLNTGTVYDLSTGVTNVERLHYLGNQTAILAGSQIGAGGFSELQGNSGTQTLIVNGASVNLSGITFTTWNTADLITINGTDATLNLLSGSSQRDTINGGPGTAVDGMRGFAGVDTLNGGDGGDTFFYNAAGEVEDGEVISGGGGGDTISLTGAGSSNFSGATITSVETVDFQSGNTTATFSGTQIGGAGAPIVNVSGSLGIDTLIVNGVSLDLSGVAFTTWTAGTDTITINGTGDPDNLTGSAKNDIIIGGGGVDSLNGGDGDDVFRYTTTGDFTGAETVTGGAGTDTLEITGGTHDFSSGTLTAISAVRFTGTGSATLLGSQIDDTFPGTIITAITGSAGTDTLIVNADDGADLSGTSFTSWTDGTDTIILNGTGDVNTIIGSSKNDIIFGGGGSDTLDGGDGDDVFRYTATGEVIGAENVFGGNGSNTVEIAGGNHDFSGAASLAGIHALIFSNAGSSTGTFKGTHVGAGNIAAVTGSAGTNAIVVNATFFLTEDTANLSGVGFTNWIDGTDTITINGTGFQSVLTGSSRNDIINGGGNNDTLNGGGGADRMEGGTGDDKFFVDVAGDLAFEASGEGADRVFAGASYTLAVGQSIETLSTTSDIGTGAINLTGNDIVNVLIGNDGVNRLDGRGAADVMAGYGGDDWYFVDVAGDKVVFEEASDGNDRVFAGVSYTLAAGQSIETLSTLSDVGTGAINLTGNEIVNVLIGNDGVNRLDGGGAADVMAGYGGDDWYFADNAGDKVVFEGASDGNDRVFAAVSYTLAAGQSIETLSTLSDIGTGAINLTGNEIVNVLIGNDGVNRLDGRGAADVMAGYGGDDWYFADHVGDKVVFEGASDGIDRVFAGVSYTLAATQRIETLSTLSDVSTTAINLTGNEFANTLIANAGANVLNGGNGADVLASYGGNDIFLFNTAIGPSNIDTLYDFVVANDTVHLENAIFTQLTTPSGNTLAAGEFFTGAAAHDADDRIIYNSGTGALFYDADGNGAGGAIQFAVGTGLALTNADFFVV